MKQKELSKRVIPTESLLSELESLQIYGGKGAGGVDPLGNTYCAGANCVCPDPGKEDENRFCGVLTNCNC